MRKTKRAICLLLILALLCSTVPLAVFAEESGAEQPVPEQSLDAGAASTQPTEAEDLEQPTNPNEPETPSPEPTEESETPSQQEELTDSAADAAVDRGSADLQANDGMWFGGYVFGSGTWNATYTLENGTHTASVQRIAFHRINANNTTSIAYCLEPDRAAGGSYGSGERPGVTGDWKSNLSKDQQRAIGLILLYGEQGRNGAAANSKTSWKWETAVQILIWEIVAGYRSSSGTYSRSNAALYNLYTGYLQNTSHTDAGYFTMTDAYDTISGQLAQHNKIPSFAGDYKATAPTHTMSVSGSNYTLTLTDTNGVLSNFPYSSQGGVTISQSGNKLTLTTPKSTDLSNLTITAKENIPKPDPDHQTYIIWYVASKQTLISTYGTLAADPVRAYFKLSAPSGKISIKKETNIPGNGGHNEWTFGVYSNAACTNEVTRIHTDSTGSGVSGSLTAGTYYVKELPGSSTSEYWVCDTSVKTVTVAAGQTASVTFTNTKYGKLKIIKTVNTGGTQWTFGVYSDAACTKQVTTVTTSTVTENARGEGISGKLLPGDYWVKELPGASTGEYWNCDTTIQKVTVIAGQTVTVAHTFENTKYGKLKIIKTVNTGGTQWTFGVYSDAACTKQVTTVTTSTVTENARGEGISGKLLPGDYWVKELPGASTSEYWICDTTIQKVTVIAGQTVTVSHVFNNTKYGKISIRKTTNIPGDGPHMSWKFGIYSNSGCSSLVYTMTTDESGKAVSEKLLPGKYWVKELPAEEATTWWKCDASVKQVTVVAGQTTPIADAFDNTGLGALKMVKTTDSGTHLGGWIIEVFTDAACTKPVDGSPFITNSSGVITTKLPVGTYWVREREDPEDTSWIYDTSVKTVTLRLGETSAVSFYNSTSTGTVRIVKTTGTGGSLDGWVFDIYAGGSVTAEPLQTVTTGTDGTIAVNLHPGTYTIRERDTDLWRCDSQNPQKVTVTAGNLATVYYHNTQLGRLRVQKQTNTGASLSGWRFQIYSGRSAVGEPLCTLTSGADGTITTDLEPGVYTILEEAKAGWVCDSQNPQTVTVRAGGTTQVRYRNTLLGSIRIVKTTSTGGDLGGWDFDIYKGDSAIGTPLQTVTTSTDGAIMAELEPGTYTVRERTRTGWKCTSTNPQTVTVTSGSTGTVSFHNRRMATVQIVKRIANIGSISDIGQIRSVLTGWRFDVFQGSSGYGSPIATVVTTADHVVYDDTLGEYVAKIAVDLEPGTYTVRETQTANWSVDHETQTVTIAEGSIGAVTFTNTHIPAVRIIKEIPTLDPELYTREQIEAIYSGWVYDIYWDWVSEYTLEHDDTITPLYTVTTTTSDIVYDENGRPLYCAIESPELEMDGYTIVERKRDDWYCDSRCQQVWVSGGSTVICLFRNQRLGSLTAQKVNRLGTPITGTKWLLEYSYYNGYRWSDWAPIEKNTWSYPRYGTCNETVVNGCLLTGADGTAQFTGLITINMKYRLTEISAHSGDTLLTQPAFEGSIPYTVDGVQEHHVTVLAVNDAAAELPSAGARATGALLAACGSMILCLVAIGRYQKRRKQPF